MRVHQRAVPYVSNDNKSTSKRVIVAVCGVAMESTAASGSWLETQLW